MTIRLPREAVQTILPIGRRGQEQGKVLVPIASSGGYVSVNEISAKGAYFPRTPAMHPGPL